MKGVLYSTVAVHRHAQEMARAFDEVGQLKLWHGGWVHAPQASRLGAFLEGAKEFIPAIEKTLSRRRLVTLNHPKLKMKYFGEMARLAAGKIFRQPFWADQIWDWQEKSLAEEAARLMQSGEFSGYLGLEHAALEALLAAKRLGVRTCLVFTSPHHTFRKKWVEDLAKKHGIPISAEEQELLRRGVERDRRRDKEMDVADLIRTNSSLVSKTLVEGGADPKKVVSVPLGADIEGIKPLRPRKKGDPIRFIVSGPVSLRKGAYFALQAWKKNRLKGATLHFYGSMQMDLGSGSLGGDGVYFYGNRSREEVRQAYRNADVLIFPTLCDGFGMVVPEAMVEGCAVITTKNAGAADWIEEGKNGWVVKAGSSVALADAMQKALDAGTALENMRQEAQATAQKNSWDDFRKRFLQTLIEQGFLKIK